MDSSEDTLSCIELRGPRLHIGCVLDRRENSACRKSSATSELEADMQNIHSSE